MRRLILTLASDTYLTESEMRRITLGLRRWEREGGVLMLPPGARLDDAGTPEPVPLPEGASLEGAAWAAEEPRHAD